MKSRSGQRPGGLPAWPPSAGGGVQTGSQPGWLVEYTDSLPPVVLAGGSRVTGAGSHSPWLPLVPEASLGSVTPLTPWNAQGRVSPHGRPRPIRDSQRLTWTFPLGVLAVLHA